MYHQNTLYSDRAGVTISSPSYSVEIKKLFISPCNKLAMTISGVKEDSSFSNSAKMKSMVDLVLKIKPSQDATQVSDDIKNAYAGQYILMITRQHTFKYKDGAVVCLDNDANACVGTGGPATLIALIAGKGIMEAFRIGAMSDPNTFMTDVDSFHRELLK
jgi:hypothetical protein